MRCIIPIVVVVTTAWLSFGCSTPPTSRTQLTAAFEFVELIMASQARLTICHCIPCRRTRLRLCARNVGCMRLLSRALIALSPPFPLPLHIQLVTQ